MVVFLLISMFDDLGGNWLTYQHYTGIVSEKSIGISAQCRNLFIFYRYHYNDKNNGSFLEKITKG